MQPKEKSPSSLQAFVETIAALRDPVSGCPWDLEQTHLTLRPYLLEETHEVLEAISAQDDAAFCDELGDVLLQVVLHAQLASERQAFSLADVIDSVNQKMIRRHPHVFGDGTAENSTIVLQNWEKIKAVEQAAKSEAKAEAGADTGKDAASLATPTTERIRGIPRALPSLTRAQRIGEKAASVHFDWERIEEVLGKVKEELREFEDELALTPKPKSDEDRRALEHEMGDLLFSLSQLSRWLGISAEESLRGTCERFIDRFQRVEELAGESFAELSTDRLEALWQQAKRELVK